MSNALLTLKGEAIRNIIPVPFVNACALSPLTSMPTTMITTKSLAAPQPRNRYLPRQLASTFLLILSDAFAVAFTIYVSAYLFGTPLGVDFALLIPPALWLLIFWREGMYPGYGLTRPQRLEKVITGSFFASLILFASKPFLYGDLPLNYAVIILSAPLSAALVQGLRLGTIRLLHILGVWGEPLIIIGAGEASTHISRDLLQNPVVGLRPVAVFDINAGSVGRSVNNLKVLGTVTQASQYARIHNIQRVVLTTACASDKTNCLEALDTNTFRHIQVLPDIPGVPVHSVSTEPLADYLTLNITNNLKKRSNQMIKRAFDLCATLVGGTLISPLLLLLFILIKLDSRGPVLYSQKRLGKDGKHFRIWKFRSMVKDADEALERHLSEHPDLCEEWNRTHKLTNDPRITRIGKVLRATSLDELPQLINVLKGEMSLVGPRPIVDAEIAKYDAAFDLYKLVRPGMTGYWQVSGRSNTSYDYRVRLDSFYTRNWSIWLDLSVLIATVRVVLGRDGAY